MSLRVTEHIFTGSTTPIASYDSTKTNLGTLMIQKSGTNPEDNFVGPMPVAVARPMEESTGVIMAFPSIVSFSSTIDWVFVSEVTTGATKRVFLYEYNKVLGTYNWKGFISATGTANGTTRGFRAVRYLHTTGTVAVGAPTSVYSTGTAALAVTGVVTGTGTTFASSHIGMMIGFGSTTPASINCWYPITTFTSTTSITVFGASNAIAATNYVIASCTVTGTGTAFATEGVSAGTASTGVAGGLGPRIGFGSTDPTQIANWYHIGFITNNTSLNITTSPGVIASGTSYVIEELRLVFVMTNSTAANGGLFVVKGVGYHDFRTAGTTLPFVASNVDNQRGTYWLADAGTVTNTTACGCAVEAEISKTEHYVYVINGLNSSTSKVYRYNIRANDSVTAGKMTLSGTNIVITGNFSVTGTLPNQSGNNGIIATMAHGPGSGSPYLYFVTTTRLYCAAVSGLTSGSTTYITAADARQEVPTGGIATYAATGAMTNVTYIPSLDRLLITTYSSGVFTRQYVTRYPSTDGTPFDHIFGTDDKQQDQSYATTDSAPHLTTGSQLFTADVSAEGILHLFKVGTTQPVHQLYALPFGAHWTYAYTASPANHQRVITPSISTSGAVKFGEVIVVNDKYLGAGEFKIPLEPYRIYYRTSDIGSDATSSWTLVEEDGDLSSVPAANAIQFMFEFFTIGNFCVPARIMKIFVTYEDGKTDSHYELSAGLSNKTSKRFVWRFAQPFGGTVPNLYLELINASSGATLLTDTTDDESNGTWEKSTDGGSTWGGYDQVDKANENTYIRYTPTSITDDVIVRAVLTQE